MFNAEGQGAHPLKDSVKIYDQEKRSEFKEREVGGLGVLVLLLFLIETPDSEACPSTLTFQTWTEDFLTLRINNHSASSTLKASSYIFCKHINAFLLIM